MRSYRIVLDGNRTCAPIGARIKVDAETLSDRARDLHATDLRLGRIVWIREEQS